MANFNSVTLDNKSLRPAPFVSTTYEYAKYNNYIIGGNLIVTLSGTLIGEDIIDQITDINKLQSSKNCVTLKIGCGESGGADFIDGYGRIRSIDISNEDQPFVASYTIVVVIETIQGKPILRPESDFAASLGIEQKDVPDVMLSYSETITIDGDGDIIGSHDTGMSISKSSIKGSGSIRLKIPGDNICDYPSYNINESIRKFLEARSKAIIEGKGNQNPLAIYRLVNVWDIYLDTKGLEITNNGDASWRFDVYLIKSGLKPKAFVDITTNDKLDQKTMKRTRTINGTIKGLSTANVADYIGHKAQSNQRITNAETVFEALDTAYLKKGIWPGNTPELIGEQDCDLPDNICIGPPPPSCYQRNSHSVTKSPISGEISFSMEFIDIDSCKPTDYSLEITIDDSFAANSIQEIIIPNRQLRAGHSYSRSIIQIINPTPRKVTITIRAILNGCDTSKVPDMIQTVCCKLQEIINSEYSSGGWFFKDQKENLSNYTYSITHERGKCDLFI